MLINHIGKCAVQKELQQIRGYLEPSYLPQLEELLKIVELQEVENLVPPLESEIPLSYRSDGDTYGIGSTATSIRGIVKKDSSIDPKSG